MLIRKLLHLEYFFDKFIFVIIYFLLVTGCTIEKRHYRNGYSMDWNRKNDFAKTEKVRSDSTSILSDSALANQNESIGKSELNSFGKTSDSIWIQPQPVSTKKSTAPSESDISKINVPAVIQSTSQINEYPGKTERHKGQKIHPAAIWSLVFGVFSFIFFVPVIGAIWLGIYAMVRIRRNPDKYKGRGLAITGIALGILCVVLFFLLFIGI